MHLLSRLSILIFLTVYCGLILLNWLALDHGAFNGDTGSMYCMFENAEYNSYITSVPIIIKSLGYSELNIVQFRYMRFAVGVVLSFFLCFAFTKFVWINIGYAYRGLNLMTMFALLVVSSLQYPFQIIAWPFGHHDMLLWLCMLLLVIYLLMRSQLIGMLWFSFVWGALAGVCMFVKLPATIALGLIFTAFALGRASTGVNRKTIINLIAIYAAGMGLVAFVYFSLYQNPIAWFEMVRLGVKRLDALSQTYNSAMDPTILGQLRKYARDLWHILFWPWQSMVLKIDAVKAGWLLLAFLAGFVCIIRTGRRIDPANEVQEDKLRPGKRTSLTLVLCAQLTTCILSFWYFIVESMLRVQGSVPYDMSFAILYLSTVALLSWPFLICLVSNKEEFDLARQELKIFYSFCLFLMFLIMAFAAGTNQPLWAYSAEYQYMFTLCLALLSAILMKRLPKYEHLIFACLFLPMTAYVISDSLGQINYYYDSPHGILSFDRTLPDSRRTKGLKVDADTSSSISCLRNLLLQKTDYKNNDIFFSHLNLSLETYLLGGNPLLFDHTYTNSYITTDFFIEQTRKIHGSHMRDAFLLFNLDDDANVVGFLKQFGLNFPGDYELLGICMSKGHPDGLRLFSPKSRLLPVAQSVSGPTSRPVHGNFR